MMASRAGWPMAIALGRGMGGNAKAIASAR